MDAKETSVLSQKSKTISLVGNPNVGKSVIFGFLTGRYVTVSNYPGTTVEVTRGVAEMEGEKVALIDTPGVNSLVPMSEDEQVTRNILLNEKMNAVIQVGDAKNLRRVLLISIQLAEMGLPFSLALNMEDEATSLGMEINKSLLSDILNVPVIGTIAIQKKGLKDIRKKVFQSQISKAEVVYSQDILKSVAEIEALLPESLISKKSLALMILSGDKSLFDWLHAKLADDVISKIDHIRGELCSRYHEPLAYVINKQRMKWVESVMEQVVVKEAGARTGVLPWIGKMSMHPGWGLVFMACVLVIIYYFVGYFGAQVAVGWLEDGLFNTYLNPWAKIFFAKVFYFSPFLQDLFVGPYGIMTMALTYALAIIFPIVITFFIAFSLMEDSGYLPRLAIMLNRIFRIMGLNGKAVVPMVLGLGCDTMATMTARIMDTKKERIILTLLLALGVPCSAQLGIVLGMLGALPLWATFLWLGVVGGALILVGFLASQIMPGQRSDFMMEIPPIRTPTGLNILTKTFARLEWYLIEVVPLFVVGTLALFFLDRLQVLPALQRIASPLVVNFLHLPQEATEAFLIGFLRRDYGATHFFDLFREGKLDAIQAIVSLIVMTLFVPCLANTLMIMKERGLKTMIAIVGFIYPFAFLIGGIINWGLRL